MIQVSDQCAEKGGVRCEQKVKALNKSVLMTFLHKIDKDFNPHLSQKTNIDSFCDKMLSNAKLFVSYSSGGAIKGLVAIYANDFECRYSYIPLLAVDSNYRHQGIAWTLMNQAIDYVRSLGTDKINCIGIHTNNPVAFHLYEKLGFCLREESQNREYLELNF